MVQDRLVSGCSTLPDPNGNEGKEWCHIDMEDESVTDKTQTWDHCMDEIDFDSLRQHATYIIEGELKKIGFSIQLENRIFYSLKYKNWLWQ